MIFLINTFPTFLINTFLSFNDCDLGPKNIIQLPVTSNRKDMQKREIS
jgi:hypothetical protein